MSTSTFMDAIVLAQGTQNRLGHAVGRKQLLPLPACGGLPIMARTVKQLLTFGEAHPMRVTVVSWPDVFQAPAWVDAIRTPPRPHSEALQADVQLRYVTLSNPGNSSLKGIARYLEEQPKDFQAEYTLVLLGDVVYSWHALRELVSVAAHPEGGFVGTSDLSSSGGEIWGVGWSRESVDRMMVDLRDALLRHPPIDDDYQPGQLRRWLVGWRRGDLKEHVARAHKSGRYRVTNDPGRDDYTMDVDLPIHVPKLVLASTKASQDDARFVGWNHAVRGGS